MTDKIANLKAASKGQKEKRTGFVIASVVIAVILVVVGVSTYLNYVVPFRRTIITVDSISINMSYFLKRTWLAGASPSSMLYILTQEEVIKLEAPLYGITVSSAEIDQELRTAARGNNASISENEFKEWYRQRLNESELSDAQFKEFVRTQLITARLQQYLAERMPTVAEQVYLHAILLKTYEEATQTRARWAAKEKSFADLARELAEDKRLRETGGVLGWFPRGILAPWADYVVFDLATDNVSIPVPVSDDPQQQAGYYLFMISEKAEARQIEEEPLKILKSESVDLWLPQAMSSHDVKYNYNSEIDAWMNWQLTKKRGKQEQSNQDNQGQSNPGG